MTPPVPTPAAEATRADLREADHIVTVLRTRFAERRRKLGLSLQRVADAAGLTKAHVWEIERGGACNPSLRTIVGLASALNVPIAEMMGLAIDDDTADGDALLDEIELHCEAEARAQDATDAIATLTAEQAAAVARVDRLADLNERVINETHAAWLTVRAEASAFEVRAKTAEARERAAVARAERLTETLQDIVRWADAYPTSVFPPPDYSRAHAVLTAAGMTLDAISAAILRGAMSRVGRLARAALTRSDDSTTTEGSDHADRT